MAKATVEAMAEKVKALKKKAAEAVGKVAESADARILARKTHKSLKRTERSLRKLKTWIAHVEKKGTKKPKAEKAA